MIWRPSRWWHYLLMATILLIVGFALLIFILAQKPQPSNITYGISFNTPYARELGLDWKETYDALLNDLNIKHLRLAAHWDMVEPLPGEYNFTELDYQISRAEEEGAEVILAIGRRLPRWPECHIPAWAEDLPKAKREQRILQYIEAVVNRYQDNEAISMWQVENEPFLEVFAFEHCGELDVKFLDKEVDLVNSLDSKRPILMTDSGNLGTWYGAYKRGDVFGTSVYVHFWNPELGQFTTFLPPWSYRVKENLMSLFYGDKRTVLIELSAEPWLLEPIVDVPIDVQLTRMNLEKFENILTYAEGTHLDTQYLWGGEWWYWLKKKGHPEMWDRGKLLFSKDI